MSADERLVYGVPSRRDDSGSGGLGALLLGLLLGVMLDGDGDGFDGMGDDFDDGEDV